MLPMHELTHGLSTFLNRTILNVSEIFRPLEEAIRYKFLPAIIGQLALCDVERDLLVLPTRLGGLGVINPVTSSDFQHLTSNNISAPLTSLILQQYITYLSPPRSCKREIKNNLERT